MSYSKFTFAEALKRFGLVTDTTTDLFPNIAPVQPTEWLRTTLEQNAPLARQISTERARCELIVAPLLVETYMRSQPHVGYFAGVEFNVDDTQGLAGYCDYLFTRAREQSVITAPVVAIVEAKKEDLKAGMGQCIAEMVAARLFNEREQNGITTIYGAVTSGTNWQFLRLDGQTVYVDRLERLLNGSATILGILLYIVSGRQT